MSRKAVSCEHFASLAYFDVVSFAFETIEQAIENQPLAFVDRNAGECFPEPRLGEHGGERSLRAVDGAAETGQQPLHPRSDVPLALLRVFQDVVIRGALLPDLRRHTVESLRAFFGARQGHIGDGPRQTAGTVVERMNGNEPEVCLGGLERRIDGGRFVEPVQERAHFPSQAGRRRSLIMDALPADWAGYDAHRPVRSVRQAPAVILTRPLRPAGNKDACQPNNRLAVSGRT